MEKRSCYLIRLSIESLTQAHAHINVNNDMIYNVVAAAIYTYLMYVSIDSLLFISKRKTHMFVTPLCTHTNPYTRNTKMHSSATKRGINNKSMQTRDCATKGARDEKIKRERKKTKS